MKKLKMKPLTFAVGTAVGTVIGSGLMGLMFAGAALAQTPNPAEPQKIEKIQVTGSNIKRVEAEAISPIQVITAEEIKQTGKQTITEILRTLPSNGSGGLNDLTGSNSFSSGASSISLRSLGSSATLVLLNGRRIAPYGLADPNFGQSSAVNLDSIPLDVVDRIEILKDGASAIYGSEAIAGVVNIILRRDYKGALVSVRGSTNYKGLYNTGTVSGSLGFGDLAADRYNVFVNVEGFSRERVGFRDAEEFLNRQEFFNSTRYRTGQRAFSSYAPQFNLYPSPDTNFVFDPATLGGVFIFDTVGAASQTACPPGQARPGQAVCRYDIWPYIDIVPKSDRANLFTRGTFDVSATTSLFAEASFNQLKTKYSSPPQVAGDIGSWFASATGRLVNIPEVLPAGNPNNPTGDFAAYRYRFTDVGPASSAVKSDTVRLFAGAKTALSSWDVEVGALYNQNKTEATSFNQIRTSVFTRAVLDGTYNFTNPSAGRVTAAQLRVDSTDTAKSSFSILDLKTSTEFGSLPGGAIGFAAGLEYRREDRRATPDVLKTQGEIVGFGAASAEGNRNVVSAYTELRLPVLKTLEVQLAGRTDKYSDYGRSTIPKVGLAWTALPSLKLRGSYAEGFRAPSLTEISKSSVSAFTTVLDPILCTDGNQNECAQPIGVLIVANPNVKPETAKTYNVGIVFEPVKDTSLSVDFYKITRRNEITSISLSEILNNEGSSDPRYAGRITRGRPGPGQTVGPIQVISTGFFNLGETLTRGVDLDVRSNFSLKEYGKLNTSLLVSYTDAYKGSGAPDAPLVSQNGFRDYPRVRSRASGTWEIGNWTNTMAANYVAKFKTYSNGDNDAGTCAQATSQYLGYCQVDDQLTFDLGTEYRGIKNLRVSFTVQNLFNKRPPADPLNRPANLQWSLPYGAYATLGVEYRFR
jgi:iron complex outermembrane recepter protein